MAKSGLIVEEMAEIAQLSVTELAKRAGIDAGDLQEVRRGTALTKGMLSKLLAIDLTGDEHVVRDLRARLTEAYCHDRLPDEARELVLIVPRRFDDDKVREAVPAGPEGDLQELIEMARTNAPLAKGLRNLLRAFKGDQSSL